MAAPSLALVALTVALLLHQHGAMAAHMASGIAWSHTSLSSGRGELLLRKGAKKACAREVAVAFVDGDNKVRVEKRAGTSAARLAAELEAGDAVAWAEYVPQRETASNFGKLRIQTSGRATDEAQVTAMGFLEGYLTAVPIWEHYLNMRALFKSSTNHTDEILEWMLAHQNWWQQKVEQDADRDDFSAMLRFTWQQVQGIVAGYNAKISDEQRLVARGLQPLTFADLVLVNSFGDMDDLLVMADAGYLTPTPRPGSVAAAAAKAKQAGAAAGAHEVVLHPDWHTMTPAQARRRIAMSGHCSALIKVTSDLSDILMGHTTWWSYSALVRLYKHYQTSLAHPAIAAQRMSFSSYPGMVHSMDDFMIASSGLVLLETSNDVYDLSQYALATSQGALSWQRFRAATMMAHDGPEWAKGIATLSSGTYVNQYMVVDLNKFEPGRELAPGLLTVVEVVPGAAYSADTTPELERGYWPSYNIPYFHEVQNRTGIRTLQAALRARGGEFESVADSLSYQVASRAKIFRRDAGEVKTLSDLKRLLRSNGWTASGKNADPFSPTVWDTICARGDLDPKDPATYGCYDAKVTTHKLALAMTAEAVNGPPWDGDGSRNGKAPFTWRGWEGVPHEGMIATYDTTFERMEP